MKQGQERYYVLEDRLNLLRRQFSRHLYDGVCLSQGEVQAIVETLTEAASEAVAMACELSSRRWNARAAADPVADLVLAQLNARNSNLVLFPVAGRPLPGDAVQREEWR